MHVGEIAPNVRGLVLHQTMRSTDLLSLLLEPSNCHRLLIFGNWSPYDESPRVSLADSLGSSGNIPSPGEEGEGEGEEEGEEEGKGEGGEGEGAERKSMRMNVTWASLQMEAEGCLGPLAPLCYIVHPTSRISHPFSYDDAAPLPPIHLIDAESGIARTFLREGGEDRFGGVLIRPDMRVACVGEFPHFMLQLKEYRYQ